MYEQSLLCGIMNDWYGSMEDLFQDLKHYGFEVLESWVFCSFPAQLNRSAPR